MKRILYIVGFVVLLIILFKIISRLVWFLLTVAIVAAIGYYIYKRFLDDE